MNARRRLVPWLLAAVLLSLPILVWQVRDRPRRALEATLAARLGAEVRLGGVQVLGRRSFVLRGLEVRRLPGFPWLRGLRVDRLEAFGSLSGIRRGWLDELRARGVEILVGPPEETAPPAAAEGSEMRIGRVIIEPGRLEVQGTGGKARLSIAGELRDVGGDLCGEARLRAGRLPLRPLLGLALGAEGLAALEGRLQFDLERPLEGFSALLEVAEGGRTARLRAGAAGPLRLRAAAAPPFPFPGIDLRVEHNREGAGNLQARVRAERCFDLEFSGRLDEEGRSMELTGADLAAEDPGLLLAALGILPQGWIVDGRAELAVRTATSEKAAGESMASEARPGVDWTMSADLQAAEIPLGKDRLLARAARLVAEGRVPARRPLAGGPLSGSLELAGLELSSPGAALPDSLFPLRLDLRGGLQAEDAGVRFQGEGRLRSVSAGTLFLEGEAGPPEEEGSLDCAWRWEGPGLGGLIALAEEVGLLDPGLSLGSAPLRARGTFSGRLGAPAVRGELKAEGLEMTPPPQRPAVRLAGGQGRVRFFLRPDRPLDISLAEISGELAIEDLSPQPFRVSGRGRYDFASGRAELAEALFAAPPLGRLQLHGAFVPAAEQRIAASLQLIGADPFSLLDYLEPLAGRPLAGYRGRADLRGRIDLLLGPGERWAAGGSATLSGLQVGSADGGRVVEGPDLHWRLAAEGEGFGGPWSVRATARGGGLQLLWDEIFADGSSLRPELQARLLGRAASPSGARRWVAEGSLRLDPALSLDTGLCWGGGGPLGWRLELTGDDLRGIQERLLLPALGETWPRLATLRAGGRASLRLAGIEGEPSTALSGRVRLDGLTAEEGDEGGLAVRGLDLDLPLEVRWARAGEASARPLAGRELRGSLEFKGLALGALELGPTAAGLLVRADRASLEKPLAIPLLGGTVTLESLALADLFRPSRHLESGVALQGLRLEALGEALGLPLEGELEGRLPRVRLTPTELEVEGGGEIRAFGGTASVGGISGRDVLSRYPRFTFSAEFREVDLEQVTRKLDFGEMSGTLQGWVRDCELFDGLPVRFQAALETVERKGVPRTITVKAINNLAILGTGGRVSVFDRGIHRFLDRYTYEKLGVRMSLSEDAFLLRGTERRGGRELFLEGRLPFRIDVVNVDPGRAVSFRAMLDRLRSLDLSTAVVEP